MAQTVIGVFETYSEAQQAAQRLEQMGLGTDQVDVASGRTKESKSGDADESENGITRFFKSLFGDNDDSDRYSSVVGKQSGIVTVHAQTDEQATRAAELLDEAGAIDVDERSTQFQTGANFSSARSDSDDSSATIPKIKEELHVGKETVDTGGVRIRSRIVEKPVEESIRLREEHVKVERESVNRAVTDADRSAFQDQDIELTERSEIPVVNKEARVVEEVTLSKEITERNETVRDTVRNTEVDIDDLEQSDKKR